MTLDLTRRGLLTALGSAAALPLALAPLPTAAETQARPVQAPGFQRWRVGDAVVTALLDGYIDIQPEWWTNISPEDLRAELDAAFVPGDRPVRLSVNAYVIETAGRVIAIDTGAADSFGPTAGRHAAALAAAGIAPESIDTLLLTHLHPDHVGGLLAADGTLRLPAAQVLAPEADHAFWTSADARAQAPESARPWFDLATGAMEAAGERLALFSGEAAVAPGLTAVPLPGHTPGHSGFVLESGTARLFFWGDVVDQAALQFNRPERSLIFDIDAAAGEVARRRALEMAASERLMVAGSHVPFPSLGHVASEGGALRWLPAEWDHEV